MDKDIRDTWKAAFGGDKPKPQTPFDGQDLIDPRAMRDWLQKPCATCGLPTVQQFAQVSHRGNFRHGGHKIVVRPVGQICKCEDAK
jgi:hypothetical protein